MRTELKPKQRNPFSEKDRENFMQQALLEGRKGLGLTSPNPPVGAVIVNDEGKILGRGFHARAGTGHAEVNAINDVIAKTGPEGTKGTNLFVTLEPCSTHGRTPPCCESIIRAGIKRVFIGTMDPNPDHAGAADSILKEAGITVVSGILQEDADYLIRFFRRRVETGLPWVIAKTAMTLDGHTTLPPERGQWISSLESRDDVQQLRRQCDAILVGGETVRTDDPMLTLRGKYAEGREQPERIVVTAVKDLPLMARIFNDEFANRTHVYHGKPLEKVLEDLGSRGICSVLMESGGSLFSHAIGRKLIDEVVFYMAPIIGGGPNTVMPVNGIMADIEDLTVQMVGPDIRVTGRVVK
jgi:diaminohydroxyphosphoribosylaminopyrimidine deaminase/5-amino-6-(5-phosphoribosylamino)uracil reductase